MSRNRVWPKVVKIMAVCLLIVSVGLYTYMNRETMSKIISPTKSNSKSTHMVHSKDPAPSTEQQQAAIKEIQDKYCQSYKNQLAADQGKLANAQQELTAAQQALAETRQNDPQNTRLEQAEENDISANEGLVKSIKIGVSQDSESVSQSCK